MPLALRPGGHGGSDHLAARLDAVFGALGPQQSGQQTGWTLSSKDMAPFNAGKGIEEYAYSSDEEAPNSDPLMPQHMIDSDQEDDDDAETHRQRMQATAHLRRAFDAEEEEDEYDRFAMASGLQEKATKKPPNCTEVRMGLCAVWMIPSSVRAPPRPPGLAQGLSLPCASQLQIIDDADFDMMAQACGLRNGGVPIKGILRRGLTGSPGPGPEPDANAMDVEVQPQSQVRT